MKLHKSETAEKQATLALIRDYLKSDGTGTEQWKSVLETRIGDPTLFFQFQSTFPGHPAVREAFVVYDALETVTNGIHDPDILEGLSMIKETSPFFCWKNLILGLSALYHGEQTTAQKFSGLIPSYAAVGSLKPFFTGFQTEKIRTLAEDPLFAPFFDDSSSLAESYLAQLSEESQAGLWDEYAATALCFLKDFSGQDYPWYRDFCVQVMIILADEDGPFEDFLQGLYPIFSKAVSLAWAAASLFSIDPETGLIYFLQSMTMYCSDKNAMMLNRELGDLLDSYSSLDGQGHFYQDEQELRVYANDLLLELNHRIALDDFPGIAADGLNKLKSFVRLPEVERCRTAQAEKKPDTGAVQLELF
jgi:hypothetical protein